MRRIILGLAMAVTAVAATPVIIDTDMGLDDMIAIALMLSHREIQIEAITVVDGLAHVKPGAANARRLVQLSGRAGIPVFEGRETPLQRTSAFLPAWREPCDRPLSNVTIPGTITERAEVWLAHRLQDGTHPVRILALGPLTNLALALKSAHRSAVQEIVIMGGAFHVPGNTEEMTVPKTATSTSEANFFVDPEAAAQVFRSGVPIRVIPLDATNRVKVDAGFVDHFKANSKGPLATIVSAFLTKDSYIYDALAAAALLKPAVATWTHAHVVVQVSGKDIGRSVIRPGAPNTKVALNASRAQFDRIFLEAFTH